MNDPLNNLPPFYVGQKVVCVVGHRFGYVKKGLVYPVVALAKAPCCGAWIVDVGVNAGIVHRHCSDCGGEFFGFESFYRTSRFAPIQQTKFPLMTFSEIRKQEEKEVLVDN